MLSFFCRLAAGYESFFICFQGGLLVLTLSLHWFGLITLSLSLSSPVHLL